MPIKKTADDSKDKVSRGRKAQKAEDSNLIHESTDVRLEPIEIDEAEAVVIPAETQVEAPTTEFPVASGPAVNKAVPSERVFPSSSQRPIMEENNFNNLQQNTQNTRGVYQNRYTNQNRQRAQSSPMRSNLRPIVGSNVQSIASNGGDRNGNYNQNGYSNYSNYTPSMPNGDSTNYTGDVIAIKGVLEILPEYGVIRQDKHPYDNPELPKDVYISQSQMRRFALRPADLVTGFARPPKEGERYLSLLRVEKVDGVDPEEAKKRPQFTKLTPIFPSSWLKLETETNIVSTRLIDLVAPIGKGQRGMLVSPPKVGKTWLLKDIANGVTTNYPDVTLLVALIGERPEEVTHFSRSVKGEVYASNFDEKADEQTRIAEICLERAKRMAEQGKDVVILMDSLTRLARAYNMVAPPSGRTLTGGFDPAALYPAKHFFGAARNFEEGGSLTIIATALVETGSRMDDVIFEEFKGTGNMELRLDKSLAERRIFPAIDIKASGTRHEEYLLDKLELEKVFRLRRMVDLLDDRDSTELVIDRLKKAKTNKEFLDNLHKGQ